ncbi:Purine nucleoside phosphorylase DeoD-type [Buchnera aphidicola (Tetraneura ulmi)]|uniref:purine-nucleoside phosphorylase n=1 Tax=Buchnera aphidicola TaxID=9 RepID=UPI003463CA14
MNTPHISAEKNSISNVVLMSGDPIRVKYIAERYLEKSVLVSNVRSMLVYTGFYKNKKVSVVGHGIGIPSCLIYVQELVDFYKVNKIIRLGTCGSVRNDINLCDKIIGLGACTDSNVNRLLFENYDFSAIADFNLVLNLVRSAKRLGLKLFLGNIFSTDLFYFYKDRKRIDLMKKRNILGIEMETAGLYGLSSVLGVRSVSICLVSDHILNKKKISISERIVGFDEIILLVLDSILLNNKYNNLNF